MSRVYRDYDQAQLNAQYSPRSTVPEARFQEYLRDYAALSAKARAALPGRLDVRYGPTADETLDLLGGGKGRPLVLLVHGGYWRMLSKADFLFPALPLLEHGIAVAGINYALAPAARLSEIVRQCRAAAAYVYRNAAELGVDRERIFVCGHSAGAHLGGMLITGDWHAPMGVPHGMLKGALLVSGLYDLEPVRLSPAQEWLGLSEAQARALSPIHLAPAGSARLALSSGGKESEEFRRQTEDFGSYWSAKGLAVRSVPMPEHDHFGVILDLARDGTPLTSALLALVNP